MSAVSPTVNPAANLIASLNSANSSIANSGSSSTGAASGTVAATSAAGLQDSFMTLLVTQLQNQDPLNPMDSGQMTSQLAQISTVDGINKLNATLQALNTSMTSSQSMSAATSLIGHNVLVPGSTINLTSGSPAIAGIQLGQGVDSLALTIKDSAGNIVRTLNLGAQQAGVTPISWDGLTNSGASASAGTYSISATAMQGGNSVPVTTLSYGSVDSVSLGSQGASLNVGNLGAVSLSSVAMVK
ncbi:MAG: flagellar hook assembly protein FlgD [Betaproteobacteria bacterium]|nr:flagellar hook assembly protein FlgD [Betaproteobacteria bacterium]MDE2621575.1 flagellar hook assembly protein FlgD [Betaproteobacteria bacterium]